MTAYAFLERLLQLDPHPQTDNTWVTVTINKARKGFHPTATMYCPHHTFSILHVSGRCISNALQYRADGLPNLTSSVVPRTRQSSLSLSPYLNQAPATLHGVLFFGRFKTIIAPIMNAPVWSRKQSSPSVAVIQGSSLQGMNESCFSDSSSASSRPRAVFDVNGSSSGRLPHSDRAPTLLLLLVSPSRERVSCMD